jgi:hypothetical protein
MKIFLPLFAILINLTLFEIKPFMGESAMLCLLSPPIGAGVGLIMGIIIDRIDNKQQKVLYTCISVIGIIGIYFWLFHASQ